MRQHQAAVQACLDRPLAALGNPSLHRKGSPHPLQRRTHGMTVLLIVAAAANHLLNTVACQVHLAAAAVAQRHLAGGSKGGGWLGREGGG